jgi:type I restriction enzyme R subunit
VDPLTAFGTPIEIVNLFGGKSAYLVAIRELETVLYPKVPDPWPTSPIA